MVIILTVIIVALIFEFINGFHDTANAIATVVSTKVLTPRQAIFLATVTNLLGAMWGTAVAKTVASGLVDSNFVNSEVLLSALIGAIVWNLITWWYGIPSSSSHAMIGGLCGATLANADNNLGVLIWSEKSQSHWIHNTGLLWKVFIPMITSPLLGFIIGIVIMTILYATLQKLRPKFINNLFGKLQIFSAAGMGFMHGTNDAQKTMGIIALALVAGTTSGAFDNLPMSFSFLKVMAPEKGASLEIAVWIKVLCAVTMAAGTAFGGWRIIRTLGHKMVKLQPIHGFAAEASSTLVIFLATRLGIPVSTTHNIACSIMGVGAAKRFSAVKWSVVERMIWAWILTIPMAGGMAWLIFKIF